MRGIFSSVSFLPVAATPFPSAPDYSPEDMDHYGSYVTYYPMASGPNAYSLQGLYREAIKYPKKFFSSTRKHADDLMKDFIVPMYGFKGNMEDFLFCIARLLDALKNVKKYSDFLLPIWGFLADVTSQTPSQIFSQFTDLVVWLFKKVFKCFIKPIIKRGTDIVGRVLDARGEEHYDWDVDDNDDDWDAETILDDDDEPTASMDNMPFFDKLRSVMNERSSFLNSEFAQRICSFIGAIICMPMFRKHNLDLTKLGFNHAFNKKFMKSHDKIHPLHFLDTILQDTAFFAEKVALVIKSKGDLRHVYVDDVEIDAYERQYNKLTYFYDKLNTIDTYGLTLREYLNSVVELSKRNKEIAYYCRADKGMVSHLKVHQAFIERCILKVSAKLHVTAEREPPIGIVLHGPPGIGKSALIDKILTCCYQNEIALGHCTQPYDKELKYHLNQTEEFMSEFRMSKEVCVLDDVDQFTDDMLLQMKGGAIAKTIEFVNPVTYITNQAHLEDKGMIPFMCKYVILTTNSYDAGLEKVFKERSGAMRRYLFLDISVRDEYRKPGETQLRNSGDPDNHEMHTFTARKYMNVSGRNNRVWWNKETQCWVNLDPNRPMSLADLQRFLYDQIQSPHYAQDDVAKSSVDRFMSAGFCANCRVNKALCSCGEVVASMDTYTARMFYRTFGFKGCAQLSKTIAEDKIEELKSTLSQSYRNMKLERKRYLVKTGVACFIAAIVSLRGLMYLYNRHLAPIPKSASSNPWVRTERSSNVTDVNRIEISHLVRICEKNLVTIRYNISGKVQAIRALGMAGNTAIVPFHWFETIFNLHKRDRLVVDFVRHDLANKAGPSRMNVILDRANFSFVGVGHKMMRDMCFLQHTDLHLFHDIRKYFSNELIEGYGKAIVVQRNKKGVLKSTVVHGLQYKKEFGYSCDYGRQVTEGYLGKSDNDIPFGSCGSPYVVDSPSGAFIVGFHIASIDGHCMAYAQRITRHDLCEPKCASAVDIDLQSHYVTNENLTLSTHIVPKNPVNAAVGTVIVHGVLSSHRQEPRSKVCNTLMAADVREHWGLLEDTHFSPKTVSSKRCLENNYAVIGTKGCWEQTRVDRAADAMFHWYVRIIKENGIVLPSEPYDRLTSINGFDGLDYVDRLPVKTSGGFQHRGRKDKYFVNIGSQPGHLVCYDLCPDVMIEYDRLRESYQRGERGMVVWDYNFKDEPISMKKLLANKVRLFNCGPLHFNVLFGQYFCPFVPMFSGKHRHLFGHAIGANVFSSDWKVIYEYLRVKLYAGETDYANFDKLFACQMMEAVLIKVITRIAYEVLMWPIETKCEMIGCATELMYAIVNVFGTVVQLLGNNPSGERITTFCNGCGNILMFMCSIMKICDDMCIPHPDYTRFTDTFRIIVYGDDCCFSTNVEEFNCVNISKAMAESGMVLTMGDKSSEMVPFVPFESLTFLKRKFAVGQHEIFKVCAPLEEASIVKSLHVCTRSREIVFEQQCAEIIYSANMEYFQYPKKVFMKKHKFFNELLDKYNLRMYIKDGVLPSYNDFVVKFKEPVCSMERLIKSSSIMTVKRQNELLYQMKHRALFGSTAFAFDLFAIYFHRDGGLRPLRSVLRLLGHKIYCDVRWKCILENIYYFRHVRPLRLSVKMAEYYLDVKRHKLGCMVPAFRRTPVMALKYFNLSLYFDYYMGCISLQNQAASFSCTSPSCFNDDQCVCMPVIPEEDEWVTDEEPMASMEAAGPVGAFGASGPSAVPTETTDNVNEEQHMVFSDEKQVSVLQYGINYLNNLFSRSTQPAAYLGDYLKRPVRIVEFPWEVNSDFTPFRFSPHDLFFNNNNIRQKINTYYLVSGTLVIRFMVNGTPFHYGRVLAAMRPINNNNTYDAFPDTTLNVANYTEANVAIPWQPQRTFYTQRPHILINPTKNIPQVMEWPFFYHLQFLEITATMNQMGYIECWVLNTLRQSNGGTDPVTITVFAHMEDVVLTGITPVASMEPVASMDRPQKKSTKVVKNKSAHSKVKKDPSKEKVATFSKSSKTKSGSSESATKAFKEKSGELDDEFQGDGIVSAPATAIANAAHYLADVPIIGKFAKATEIGARSIGKIASIFGWSNPAILDKHQFIINGNSVGRMTQTSGNDPTIRLGLDPKGELTVDPSVVGLNDMDEMSFKYISQREALFFQQTWSTDGALDSSGKLLTWRVHPMLSPEVGAQGSYNATHRWQTPVSAITLPFKYWTGSLVYRVQVVCSAMHKGRLAVVYQPINTAFFGDNSYDTTEHFNYIIDIAKETDVSFEVKYQQPFAWANVAESESVDLITKGSTALGDNNASTNGYLSIYVVNALAAPTDSSQVYINLYIRAGDDYRVAVTNNSFSSSSYSELGGLYDIGTTIPTASMEPVASMEQPDYGQAQLIDEDCPNQEDHYTLNPSIEETDNTISLVYMGEHIDSIRALMKRYQVYTSFARIGPGSSAATTASVANVTLTNLPVGRALVTPYGSSGSDGYHTNQSNVRQTYIRHFLQGYAGWKGSLRYKWLLTTSNIPQAVQIVRETSSDENISVSQIAVNGGTAILNQEELNPLLSTACSGAQAFPCRETNSFWYELPFYALNRFQPTQFLASSAFFVANEYRHLIAFWFGISPWGNTTNNHAITYVATGEDFNLHFLLGFPPIFSQPNIVG